MPKYLVETEQGKFEVETEGEISRSIPTPSLAERASTALRKPELSLPLAPLAGAPLVPKITQAAIEADRRVPVEESLPLAGGVVGGVLGGLATLASGAGVPFGATAGSIIGGQAGAAAGSLIRASKGRLTPPTIGESIKETGLKGLEMGAFELAGAGAAKIIGTLFARVGAKKGFHKFVDFLSEKVGKPLSESDAGKLIRDSFEELFGKKEAALESGFAEKKAASEALTEQENDALVAAYDKAVALERDEFEKGLLRKQRTFGERFGATASRFGAEELTPAEAGEKVGKEFAKRIKEKRSVSSELFDDLREKAGGVKAPIESDAAEFVQQVFKREGISAESAAKSEAEKMINKRLLEQYDLSRNELAQINEQLGSVAEGKLTSDVVGSKTLNAYKSMASLLNRLDNPNLTVADLMLMRTEVGRFAYSSLDDPIKNVYKGLYGSLTEDIARGAERGGFPDLARNARALYRGIKQTEEGKVARILENRYPGEVVDAVSKSSGRVNELYSNISPEGKDAFKRGLLDRIRERSTDEFGNMDFRKTYNQLNRMTDEIKREIFEGDFETIKRFERFAKIMSDSKLESTLSKPKRTPQPKLEKPKFFSEVERRTASLIRGREPGDVVDSLIGRGRSGERIEAAFNFMDEQGKVAFKKGLLGRIFNKPETLEKLSDETLTVVFGKDAGVFKAFREFNELKDSVSKTSILTDMANTSVILYWPRMLQGLRGMSSKSRFGQAGENLLRREGAQELISPFRRVQKGVEIATPQLLKTGSQ